MNNYDYHPMIRDEEPIFVVIENRTELEIASFYFEEDAADYTEELNKGAAFDGYTPKFILNKVVISKDLNAEFSHTFDPY